MLVHDSKNYRIEEHKGLPKRFSVDHKERRDGKPLCLVNIGWCDWRHQAFQLMNQHALAKEQNP